LNLSAHHKNNDPLPLGSQKTRPVGPFDTRHETGSIDGHRWESVWREEQSEWGQRAEERSLKLFLENLSVEQNSNGRVGLHQWTRQEVGEFEEGLGRLECHGFRNESCGD